MSSYPKTIFEGNGTPLKQRFGNACAHVALASWLGIPDLPEGLHAYHTLNPNGGIILRAELTGIQTLVTGRAPAMTLLGWATAQEIRARDEWWNQRPPGGWYVPQSALHSMDELRTQPVVRALQVG